MENLLNQACRLCNYQSDQRLMLNILEEQFAYADKIDKYLDLKVKYPYWVSQQI